MRTPKIKDERFGQAMYVANFMGLLTNVYIGIALYIAGGTIELLSPGISFIYFLVQQFLLKRNLMKPELAFFLASIVVVFEISYHTFALGWTSGFYYFMFILPALFFLNSNWKIWVSIAYNLLIIDFLASIWLVFRNKEPILEPSRELVSFLGILNLACTCIIVLIVLIYFRNDVNKKDTALKEQNRVLLEQNEEIKIQHGQQEILLKEIHHRVKNNLQVISSLISLQKNDVNDEESIVVLEEVQQRIGAIALIHQKLYQDERVDRVNFSSYLEELLLSQKQMNDKVNCVLECDEKVPLHLDIALPLGLIVSELISNAYKYAFSSNEKPYLGIFLERKVNGFQISVKDNGPGMPANFSFENADSLGMEIIQALVEQIDARFSYMFEDGARFEIEFK